ncbi:MAG TPA: peptidoglycan-associated lipoprotein Pal [Gammaproteobacteria bacterium]
MTLRHFTAGLMMAGVLAMGGCTSIDEKAEVPVDEQPVGAAADEGASASGAQLGAGQDGAAMTDGSAATSLDDPNSPLSKRIFYFAYDSSDLSDIDRDILTAHARFLANNPTMSVVIEGHADERGSREYNLALGERRARAIEQVMTLQGAQKRQLQVVSFGEERPVAMGHDDESWRQNRRVELIYPGR